MALYDQLATESLPSLLDNDWLYQDHGGTNRAKLSWKSVPLAAIWSPQYAQGAVRPFIDYTRVSQIPVFSHRAVAVLRECLMKSPWPGASQRKYMRRQAVGYGYGRCGQPREAGVLRRRDDDFRGDP